MSDQQLPLSQDVWGPVRGLARGRAGILTLVGLVAVALLGTRPVPAQALRILTLPGGTVVVEVAEPEASATTVAWPVEGGEGQPEQAFVTAGELTLVADLENRLGTGDETAPPVIVGVGRPLSRELVAAATRSLAGRPRGGFPSPAGPLLVEGGLERRLGRPGAEANLRLHVPLPGADDPRRPSLDVLAELIPSLVEREVGRVGVRREPGGFVLERVLAPEAGALTLNKLRIALARLAAAPEIDPAEVERVASRLQVARHAVLGRHPEGAAKLLAVWRDGGVDGIRTYLFALSGVTVESVRAAARGWLPDHPGAAVLLVPPRALNPRFAGGPRREVLANSLSTAVLERPAAPLSALCLRPVVVPDVDGEVVATVLTRLAARIRSTAFAPGWVRVETAPARLEMAASVDEFAELCEALAGGLRSVLGDRSVLPTEDGPRRRALDLMGTLLGLADAGPLTPAGVLAPENLALGAVAPDGEAAIEALHKLLDGIGGDGGALSQRPLAGAPRTRVAVPGPESVVAAELPLPTGAAAPEVAVAGALLMERGARLFPDHRVELVRPLVPGRRLLAALIGGRDDLRTLDELLGVQWEAWFAPATEEELTAVRRHVAADLAATASGVLGDARRCAEIAAGAGEWRAAGELERMTLATSPEDLEPLFNAWRDRGRVRTTAAGPLPADELPLPKE